MANDYLLGMYEKAVPSDLTWSERLETAGASGFDYVEISVDESDERLARLQWTAAERRNLVGLMQGTGVPIRSMCLSALRKYPYGSTDEGLRARGLEITEGAVRLACDLGLRTVMIPGYDVYYEQSTPETQRLFAETLARAVDIAAREGVVLAFETMEPLFMDKVSKAMAYVDLIDSPYLSVYPDLGNITNGNRNAGTSVADDLRSGKGHIVAAHLKETRPGIYRDLMFGDGETAFDEALPVLVELGIRRYVGEFWYLGNPEWRDDVLFAAKWLRARLDNAFATARD